MDRLLADSALQPLRVKIDPGSTTTGMALVRETEHTTTVLGLFELSHRGRQISAALRQGAHFRRRRCSTHLRYRAPRFSKWNRARCGIPKTHALDAVCVGVVEAVRDWHRPTLTIKAIGRESYQRTRLTPYGFPRGYLPRKKQVHGFQTGDLVKAVVPSGKKVGIYLGRVAVRASGSFNIQGAYGVVQGISYKHCRVLQRNDGYGYAQCPKIAAPA